MAQHSLYQELLDVLRHAKRIAIAHLVNCSIGLKELVRGREVVTPPTKQSTGFLVAGVAA